MNTQNKFGCLYFHQGWSDIILCLPLINYYRPYYDKLYVLIRFDAKELVDFYVRNMDNVCILYIVTDNGRYYGEINTNSTNETILIDNNLVTIPMNYDILFHGEHDKWRKDKYQSYWYQPDWLKKRTNHFSEMFYIFYDIDFNYRINNFLLDRDLALEDKTYNNFIEKYGENYIIYHDDIENHLNGYYHVSTKIEFNNIIEGYSYINLNKLTKTFFDYIKIIKNAKEIHLIDSIWGVICYQLDAKYGLFKDKQINLYCKRNHQNMFLYPIKLDNWKLI